MVHVLRLRLTVTLEDIGIPSLGNVPTHCLTCNILNSNSQNFFCVCVFCCSQQPHTGSGFFLIIMAQITTVASMLFEWASFKTPDIVQFEQNSQNISVSKGNRTFFFRRRLNSWESYETGTNCVLGYLNQTTPILHLQLYIRKKTAESSSVSLCRPGIHKSAVATLQTVIFWGKIFLFCENCCLQLRTNCCGDILWKRHEV